MNDNMQSLLEIKKDLEKAAPMGFVDKKTLQNLLAEKISKDDVDKLSKLKAQMNLRSLEQVTDAEWNQMVAMANELLRLKF